MLSLNAKDAVTGPGPEERLALIQTIIGENGGAISTLTHLLQTPYSAWLQELIVKLAFRSGLPSQVFSPSIRTARCRNMVLVRVGVLPCVAPATEFGSKHMVGHARFEITARHRDLVKVGGECCEAVPWLIHNAIRI